MFAVGSAEAPHVAGQIAALAAAAREYDDGGVGILRVAVLHFLRVFALRHLVDRPVAGDTAVAQIRAVAPSRMGRLAVEFAQGRIDLQPRRFQRFQKHGVFGGRELFFGHPHLIGDAEYAHLAALFEGQGIIVVLQQHAAFIDDAKLQFLLLQRQLFGGIYRFAQRTEIPRQGAVPGGRIPSEEADRHQYRRADDRPYGQPQRTFRTFQRIHAAASSSGACAASKSAKESYATVLSQSITAWRVYWPTARSTSIEKE